MTTHNYYCDNCDHVTSLELNPVDVNAKGYVNKEAGYYTRVLVSSLSEQEIKDLPMEKDPRDYEVYEEYRFKEVPDKFLCEICYKKVGLMLEKFEGWCKGNCFTNRERERKFYEKGMDKQQASEFYKESIAASKERRLSGGQHYKEVVPDMKKLRDHGIIRKTSDSRVAAKKQALKEINVKLHEMAKIDPSKKK
jgi:hypothetical protein